VTPSSHHLHADILAFASCSQFHEILKDRDPAWGLRNLEEVVAAAEACGLKLVETVEMPANNLSVIFRKEE
jgi:Protein of unknown function (DUF938)